MTDHRWPEGRKAHLTAQRQALIEREKVAPDHATRTALQAELSTVNAELKAIGAAEHADNLRRRAERNARLNNAERANRPPGMLTRGEYSLRTAKELARELGELKSPKPHAVDIIGPLRTFIEAEKEHVKQHNAELKAHARADDGAWRETWEDGRG